MLIRLQFDKRMSFETKGGQGPLRYEDECVDGRWAGRENFIHSDYRRGAARLDLPSSAPLSLYTANIHNSVSTRTPSSRHPKPLHLIASHAFVSRALV